MKFHKDRTGYFKVVSNIMLTPYFTLRVMAPVCPRHFGGEVIHADNPANLTAVAAGSVRCLKGLSDFARRQERLPEPLVKDEWSGFPP